MGKRQTDGQTDRRIAPLLNATTPWLAGRGHNKQLVACDAHLRRMACYAQVCYALVLRCVIGNEQINYSLHAHGTAFAVCTANRGDHDINV